MKRVAFVIFMVLSNLLTAQEAELWSDINLYKNINTRLIVFGDAGPRVTLEKNAPYGFYIRPSVSFKTSNSTFLAGGAAWFYVTAQERTGHEFRGWQGIRFEFKILDRITVSGFNRLEERWFFENGERSFLLRFRALAGLIAPLNHETLEKNTWYVPLAFEIFEDLNDHQTVFINRNRVYTGLGYALNDKTRMEVFYIANESRSNPEDRFNTVDVVRLRMHFIFPDKPMPID